ncbi:SEC-C domain-containing protein, partial [Candidatus Babeliales bacterium]|nr:SEC-C domain-containing protein [Candidatus Babeliales bacterium]
VTIATNMAGRGVDIKLGGEVAEEITGAISRILRRNNYEDPYDMSLEEKHQAISSLDPSDYGIYQAEVDYFLKYIQDMESVRNLGGLHVIGSERHESRRIDNQLRGRAGRQGDPGSSRFYLSMEDELMRLFGGQQAESMMVRMGIDDAMPLEVGLVSRLVEQSQSRVEGANFDVRKHLLEYDDVLNQQRTVVYSYRREVLEGEDHIQELIKEMITDVLHRIFSIYCPKTKCSNNEVTQVLELLEKLTKIEHSEFERADIDRSSSTVFEKSVRDFLVYQYEQYRALVPQEIIKEAEKWLLLETIDRAWRIHLQNIDQLKEGIGLRGYGQKNPLVEYKKESFTTFESMMAQIKWDVAQGVFRMKPDDTTVSRLHEIETEHEKELDSLKMGGDESGDKSVKTVKRDQPKVRRNEPCPCGSGKKYKHCCGR